MQTESGMYEAPWIQEKLDYSGAPAIPTADAATRQKMTDALYGMGARYLDPQYKQQHEAMDSKLSNQGIFVGSDAYKDSQGNLADQEARDYGQLRDQSIAAGGDEMARQYGMGMQAHQTGVNDITQQGNFANAARGQLVGELQSDMNSRNAAIAGQANIATGQQIGVEHWYPSMARPESAVHHPPHQRHERTDEWRAGEQPAMAALPEQHSI
jgi:hypothetical protein